MCTKAVQNKNFTVMNGTQKNLPRMYHGKKVNKLLYLIQKFSE
jgi:hypothetical protein